MNTSHKKIHITSANRGFTLIEVLIAVVIFSTSLAGLLLIVGTGIGNINVSKNRLIANYLAQEGIEIMRYKRDYQTETHPNVSNISPSPGWTIFANMMTDCDSVDACGVTAVRPLDPPVNCTGNVSSCRIVQHTVGNPATGAYDIFGSPGASGWTPTIYSRFVYVETPTNNSSTSYVIHSVVKWNQGSGVYVTSMSETIYDWQ